MIKSLSLLTRKSTLSKEEFRRIWLSEHAPLVHAVPQVRRYVLSFILEEPTRPDVPTQAMSVDAVAELWYDDMASLKAAAASPADEGRDRQRRAPSRRHQVVHHGRSRDHLKRPQRGMSAAMRLLSRPNVGLLVVGLGIVAAPLDTAVNIAFPSITRAFGLQVQDIRWVVIAYVLTYASLMLVFGRLGDLLGYRRIFQLGLLISAAGFAACALAPTYPTLLLGRMLQGVGIALTLSCAPALAVSLFEEKDRTRVLGVYAAITAAGSAIGPLVGGFLVERAGWPAVFWSRAPIVLVALALSWLIPAGPRSGSMCGFDAVGAALLVVWFSALLLVFAVDAGPLGLALPLGLAVLAVLGFAAFAIRQARQPQPLIRLSLFRDAGFAVMNAASIAVNLTAFAVLLLVPYYLVRIAHLDAAAGGIVLACGAGGTVIGSWLAGRLAARVAIGRLALAGVVLSIAGLWTISTWTPTATLSLLASSLLLQGLGVGLFQVAYADLVIATLPAGDRGVAGSLTIVTRTIGVVGGVTALSAAFRHFEAAALSSGADAAQAFLAGFQTTFFYAACALALSLAISMLRPRTWS